MSATQGTDPDGVPAPPPVAQIDSATFTSRPPVEEHPIVAAKRRRGSRATLAIYGVLFLLLAAARVALDAYFPEAIGVTALIRRLILGGMAVLILLALSKVVETWVVAPLDDAVQRYNLMRVLRLVTAIAIAVVLVNVMFVNWYTAIVSLGLISLVLGFALQTPITSFIAWVYILVRSPYRIGDRIRIGESRGDVIDVSYLDTTLWEFGGELVSTEHPTGRIIKFPNALVFTSAIYNYSWPLFPYVWNEVKFQIAYDSDLGFVAQTMQQIAEEELGEHMMSRVKRYREILSRTPVDQLEVRERPSVFFRVSEYAWIDAIVRYVVEPRRSGRVKNELIRKMLERMNREPERVRFPKGDMR